MPRMIEQFECCVCEEIYEDFGTAQTCENGHVIVKPDSVTVGYEPGCDWPYTIIVTSPRSGEKRAYKYFKTS